MRPPPLPRPAVRALRAAAAFASRVAAAVPERTARAAEAAAAGLAAWARRLAAPWFRPDATVAPDPLAPDPRVLARGVEEALRLCAASARPVRLLLARTPGAAFRVRLHAVRRTCLVERLPPEEGASGPPAPGGTDGRAPPVRSERAVPAFSPGLAPADFVLDGEGDNVRLLLLPGPPSDPRVRLALR